jgi:hypothetical protein
MSQITGIFNHLAQRAVTSGQDQSHQFQNGVRIAVRVKEGMLTLTITRAEMPVSDVALITFQSGCIVPPDAKRKPHEGQGTTMREGQRW